MSTQDLTVPKSLAARVRAGVAFLDEQEPGWHRRVAVRTLKMQSTCNCVLGQLVGDFNEADKLYFGADEYTAIKLGFDADYHQGYTEFRVLQRLWSFVIRQRQAVSQ